MPGGVGFVVGDFSRHSHAVQKRVVLQNAFDVRRELGDCEDPFFGHSSGVVSAGCAVSGSLSRMKLPRMPLINAAVSGSS